MMILKSTFASVLCLLTCVSALDAETTCFDAGVTPRDGQLFGSEYDVLGLRFNPWRGLNESLTGLDVGVINELAGDMNGGQLSLWLANDEGDVNGVALGLGCINCSGALHGVAAGPLVGFANGDSFGAMLMMAGGVSGPFDGVQMAGLFLGHQEMRGVAIAPIVWGSNPFIGVEASLLSWNHCRSHCGVGLSLASSNTKGLQQGVHIGLVYCTGADAHGWIGGGLVDSDTIVGVSTSVACDCSDLCGMQLGAIVCAKRVNGVQVALINEAWELSGLQVGVVNHCDKATRGVQIGIWNEIEENAIPVLPLLNCRF